MLLTLAAAAVLLGVVIFVHEFGHFLAAKAVGVGVPRFSIGFGAPTPLRWKRGETEYVVAWLPLGGYVKLATAEEDPAGAALEGGNAEDFPPEKLFENKPLWARIMVISAGVTMNVLLAWLLYIGLAFHSGELHDATTRIAGVTDSLLPAAAQELASLPFGTRIERVNGDTISTWDGLVTAMLTSGDTALVVSVSGRDTPLVMGIPARDSAARVAVVSALQPLHEPIVSEVAAGLPAAKAGIRPGDQIVRVGHDTIRTWQDLVDHTQSSAGDTLQLSILRGDSVFGISVVPHLEAVPDLLSGTVRNVALIGLTDSIPLLRRALSVGGAVTAGTAMTAGAAEGIWLVLKGLVLRQVSVRQLGGPIAIGQQSGQFAREGFVAFLGFMAFISVNLAVLNILPIPVLDGGHLVFLALEGIRRRPVSIAVRARVTQVGLALLLALMLFVIVNDVARIVR